MDESGYKEKVEKLGAIEESLCMKDLEQVGWYIRRGKLKSAVSLLKDIINQLD